MAEDRHSTLFHRLLRNDDVGGGREMLVLHLLAQTGQIDHERVVQHGHGLHSASQSAMYHLTSASAVACKPTRRQ